MKPKWKLAVILAVFAFPTAFTFDAYAVLGVAKDASQKEISRAYKKAALQSHPDKLSTKPEKERLEAEKRFATPGQRELLLIQSVQAVHSWASAHGYWRE